MNNLHIIDYYEHRSLVYSVLAMQSQIKILQLNKKNIGWQINHWYGLGYYINLAKYEGCIRHIKEEQNKADITVKT